MSAQPLEAPRPFIIEEKSDGAWLFVDAFEHLDEGQAEMARLHEQARGRAPTRRMRVYRLVFVLQYTRGT